jgi:SPP1 family predicted phage head-tail adaptor
MAWVIVTGGLETIKAGAEVAVTQASIRIPYKPMVTPSMRVIAGVTVFEITAVNHDEGGRKFTDLVCKAIFGAKP